MGIGKSFAFKTVTQKTSYWNTVLYLRLRNALLAEYIALNNGRI